MNASPLHISEIRGKVHVAIITIRPDEYSAVDAYFEDTRSVVGGKNSYETALFHNGSYGPIRATLTRCVAQGNLDAQAITGNVIADLDPAWIVLAGIAGGLPDFEYSLGDVIIASALHDFSFGASTQGDVEYQSAGGAMMPDVERFLQTKPFGKNGARLLDLAGFSQLSRFISHPAFPATEDELAGSLYGSEKYRGKTRSTLIHRFKGGRRSGSVRLWAGPCANGNLVVKDPELVNKWKASARQISLVETELAGVYRAARSAGRQNYPVLAIRGLSDIVGLMRKPDWTQYACETAAAVTWAVLRSGFIDFRANLPNAEAAFAEAAKADVADMGESDAIRVIEDVVPWELNSPESTEKLRDALRIAPRALGYWKLAAFLAREGRSKEALEALALGDKIQAPVDLPERSLYAALVFMKSSGNEEAEPELRAFLKTGRRELHGIAYDLLGTIKRDSDVAGAADLYRAAVEAKKRTGDDVGRSISLGNLGRLLLHQNRFDEASSSFRKNLQLTTELNNVKSLGIVKNNLAEALLGKGSYEEAMTLLRDVSESPNSSNVDRGYALGNIGQVYVLQRNLENAVVATASAREAFEAAGNSEGLFLIEEIDGLIALARNWTRTAQTRFNIFDDGFKLALHGLLRIYRYRRRAEIAASAGLLEQMIRHLEGARSIAHEQGIPLLADIDHDEDVLRKHVSGFPPELGEGTIWLPYWQNRLPFPLALALPKDASDPMGMFLFVERVADLLILILDETGLPPSMSIGGKVGVLRELKVKLLLEPNLEDGESILRTLGTVADLRNSYVHKRAVQPHREEVASRARALLEAVLLFVSQQVEVYEVNEGGKCFPLVGVLVDVNPERRICARLGTACFDITERRSTLWT